LGEDQTGIPFNRWLEQAELFAAFKKGQIAAWVGHGLQNFNDQEAVAKAIEAHHDLGLAMTVVEVAQAESELSAEAKLQLLTREVDQWPQRLIDQLGKLH
jgi:hypothetical protein